MNNDIFEMNVEEQTLYKEYIANGSIILKDGTHYIPSKDDVYGEIPRTYSEVVRYVLENKTIRLLRNYYTLVKK